MFRDRGHSRFMYFDSIIPAHVIRVKFSVNRPFAGSDHVVGQRHAREQTSQRRLKNKECEKGEA